MKIVKNGEIYSAVNDGEKVVAYIEKNRFGTHGHWRGWNHLVFSDKRNDYVYAERMNMDNGLRWWDDPSCVDSDQYIPVHFCNVKEFKEYYEKR